ncbi:MAG TPA: hypothetical protein VGJ55_08035 [Pyrinomonadaceae bacterium]|jgi:hypothetical protein
MNYFNYFTEIEDTFVRRRGKHLLLSSMDWALIESWKEMGVPLHVALRGIEQAFDSYEAKPRKRSVKTLLYCQEEVEAQYAEWLESRVGASEEDAANIAAHQGTEAKEPADCNVDFPFSRVAILEYLQRVRGELPATREQGKGNASDSLNEAIGRAASLVADLEKDFAGSTRFNAQQLEVSLTGIERMLNEALVAAAESETLDAYRNEVAAQLKPYRHHMEPAAYRMTLDNLLLKRLRDQFGVPRLSLFYL